MTRIAVLSDVHGNTPALAAVLAAIDTEGVDLVLNLGDIVSGAVDPRGTLDLLATRRDIVTVRGDDDATYLTETVVGLTAEHPAGVREATDAELVERLGTAYGAHALYLCGHTHLARTRQLPDGSLLVNPGSVGWPAYEDDISEPHRVEVGAPEARYAIVSRADDVGDVADSSEGRPGGWEAQLVAVPYDHEEAAASAERFGRADVAHALRTGRLA